MFTIRLFTFALFASGTVVWGAPRLVPATPVVPVSFELNRGQTDPVVRYLARSNGAMAFLVDDGAVLETHSGSVRMRFERAGAARISASEELPGVVRYVYGERELRVKTFGAVRYAGMYPGIDLVFYGNGGELEYDLRIAPHANPSAVKLRFEGARRLAIDSRGNLLLDLKDGSLQQHAPVAWQMVGTAKKPVAAQYEIGPGGTVAFRFGTYDPSRELIIDPVLTYSSYVSGSNSDSANAIAIDNSNNILIAGTTSSPNFPTQNALLGWSGGVSDAFVMKLGPDGKTVVYSTYLGSPSDDTATAIAVDAQGNAYVTGRVSRPGYFPDIYDDKRAYVAKLDPQGGLVYSTTIEGSGGDEAHGIAVDARGQAYITGYADGGYERGYPVVNGFQQATGTMIGFVTVLDATGRNIVYSTNITGNGPGPSMGNSIAVDANGFIYVAGSAAPGMLTTPGAYQPAYQGDVSDAFVAKIDPRKSGMNSLVYLTYLGSAGTDAAHGIAVEADGSVWVAGSTNSSAAGPPFPTTPSAMQPSITFDACRDDGLGFPTFCEDAFIAKLDSSGSRLLYSTLMGGKGTDIANAIALDGSGHAWVTGRASSSFPVSGDALQPKAKSGMQAFLAEIDPSKSGPASVPYSTYAGGSGSDVGQAVAISADMKGVYLAGFAGSSDFPLKNPLMNVGGGPSGSSAFLMRFSTDAGAAASIQVQNAASYAASIAPGSLFSIFGSGLSATTAQASSLPLDSTLAGVSVDLNGVPARLLYVSPSQINAQAPFSLSAGSATVTVRVNGSSVASGTVAVALVAPGIFQFSGNRAVVTNDDYSLNTSGSPAHVGRWITIYITGQGSYDRDVPDGAGAPSSPLALTAAATAAAIGGKPARVLFSGGAPGFAGVSQVNVEVPQDLAPGDQTLIVQIGGVSSNSTLITVAN